MSNRISANVAPLALDTPVSTPQSVQPTMTPLRRPLPDRLVVGLKTGGLAATPVALVVGSSVYANALFPKDGMLRARIALPIIACGAASGAAAAALNLGPAGSAVAGAVAGAGSGLLTAVRYDDMPAILVAGAVIGGISGLATAYAMRD